MTKKQTIFSIVMLAICFLGSSYVETKMQAVDDATRASFNQEMVLMNQ